MIRACNSAFKMRDSSLFSTARPNLRKGIQQAKEAYRRNMEGYLMDNNPWQMWSGIQAITNYRDQSLSSSSSYSSAQAENNYFACFETSIQSFRTS